MHLPKDPDLGREISGQTELLWYKENLVKCYKIESLVPTHLINE